MENGMTGLDPEKAKEQIYSFIETCLAIKKEYETNGIAPFLRNLSYSWCSPRAVEFGKKQIPRLFAIANDIETIAGIIGRNAARAFDFLARANGLSRILGDMEDEWYIMRQSHIDRDTNDYEIRTDKYDNPEIQTWSNFDPNYYFSEASRFGGIVGMNKTIVKLALNELNGAINDCINGLNNLPMDIALYDPSGEMMSSFKNLIKKMVSEDEEIIKGITDDINVALEEEQDRIELAKEQATQAMNA